MKTSEKFPFSLSKNIKGKRYTYAYVSASCLAVAKVAARSTGFDTNGLDENYTHCLEKQKQWGGVADCCVYLEPDEQTIDKQWFLETFRHQCYENNFDKFVKTFPEAEKYRQELTSR